MKKPTKAQQRFEAFSERLYRLLRDRPEPGSTAVGKLSQGDTALYDAIRDAAKELIHP